MPRVLETLDLFVTEPARSPPSAAHPARSEAQLWIAVHLPGLPLECLAGLVPANPAVVVDGQGQREVVACNERAQAAGIGLGMKLATAMALVAQLTVLEREQSLERASLEGLAAWAMQLTSLVSVEPPESVLLEVSGSLGLFGGLEAIKARLGAELARRQHRFRVSTGPTPTAALWLARAGAADVEGWHELAGRLGALPLAVTRWPSTVQALLRDLGVRTIGDCVRLPREGFARRVGRGHLQELDKAFGRQFDLRSEFRAPESWSAALDLFEESADSVVLLAALEQLVDDLAAELRERQAQIRRLRISFEHFHHAPTLESIEALEPTHDRERLFALVRDRLERRSVPVPVCAVRVSSDELVPMQLREQGLFEPKPHEERAQSLLERLQGRFGMAAVYGLRAVAEHRPEKAWAKLSSGRSPVGNRGACCVARPLWLLPEPMPLASSRVRGRARPALTLCSGPERIQSGWWDGDDIARDYYAAENSQGQLLWIFRDRRSSSWYVHGFFG